MNIVIFGANGADRATAHPARARRRPLRGGGDPPTRRLPAHRPRADRSSGADVHDAAALVDIVAGADAVLSTLGVPFTRESVDTYSVGTANIVAAMHETDTRRLVVVSSTGAYPAPGRIDAPFALRIFEPVITRTIGKTVYDDMRRMETIVRDSGSGLDDRAPVGAVRPAVCHRIRCRRR